MSLLDDAASALKSSNSVMDEAMKAMRQACIELDRLHRRVQHLENTLAVIAACENKTLLGGSYGEMMETAPNRDPTPELAHEIGANKAFAECGRMAREALES